MLNLYSLNGYLLIIDICREHTASPGCKVQSSYSIVHKEESYIIDGES